VTRPAEEGRDDEDGTAWSERSRQTCRISTHRSSGQSCRIDFRRWQSAAGTVSKALPLLATHHDATDCVASGVGLCATTSGRSNTVPGRCSCPVSTASIRTPARRRPRRRSTASEVVRTRHGVGDK